MGGLGSLFFGESAKAETRKTDVLTPEQQAALGKLGGYLSGQIGESAPVYQGQRVAGSNELLDSSNNLLQQLLGSSPELMKQLQGMNTTITPQGPTTGPQVDQYNPQQVQDYFQTAIADPARRQFTQTTMPALQEQFAAIDATDSGAARRAMASANVDFNLGLNSQLAGLQEGERNRLRDLQFQSDTLSQQGMENFAARDFNAQTASMQAELDKLFGIPGFGAQLFQTGLLGGQNSRGIANEQLSAEMQKFNEANPALNPALNLLPSLLGANAYQVDTIVQPSSAGLLTNMMQGASSALGQAGGEKLGGMMFG